jgi:hypothetical protein
LYLALERMSKHRPDVLPVVHQADLHKLEGVVTLPDVLDTYGIDRFGLEELEMTAHPCPACCKPHRRFMR